MPTAMDRAIQEAGGGDAYQFWRQFSPEAKFLLKLLTDGAGVEPAAKHLVDATNFPTCAPHAWRQF